MELNMTPVIEQSFTQYAGAVLQSRALVDARDFLKPSARQIFYCLYTDKFLSSKPFKKTLKAIGSASRMYIHGDSSCEGVIMRAGQPFAMRYPIIEVDGSYGNLTESGNWAASRYTSSRLSPLAEYLFEDIQKNTIEEWRDNYDDTEQYPVVVPSKGFYNLVNGTSGIGIALSSNVPQFNIREVNKALITLLKNPDCDFEDIYCAPDFATGAILLNEQEVKESLKNGKGKSCMLRSVIEYDEEENCLIATEIPYGVYTNTICGQLEKILEEGSCPSIERFNDLTGSTPRIKIYLTKRANPQQVIKFLYKNTSLQYFYGINMTMLDNGRYPRVFGWKELLQAHINHEKIVYRKGFEFDLKKAKDRLHIVEGIIIAINNIEEVIRVIKESSSTYEASVNLQNEFALSEIQAKAILEIKLSRLAHLETEKFIREKNELLITISKIEAILNNEELLNEEIIKKWQFVSDKFGDERRTKIMNLDFESEDEPIEKKQLVIHLTNKNSIYAYEDTTLIASRKGKGSKIKLGQDELIIQTIKGNNSDNLLLFSSIGKVYTIKMDNLPLSCRTPIESILDLSKDEIITTIVSDADKTQGDMILFVTSKGMVKKTDISEYRTNRSKGIIAINLSDGDSIKKVMVVNDNNDLMISSELGFGLIFGVKDIPTTSRNTKGVKGISLRENDKVSDAIIIKTQCNQIISVTKNGMIKKSERNLFAKGSRANKGNIIHKIQDDDLLVAIGAIYPENKNVSISSTSTILKFSLNEVRLSDRSTIGTKAINLKDDQYVTGMIIE